jgi:hypothetical protein
LRLGSGDSKKSSALARQSAPPRQQIANGSLMAGKPLYPQAGPGDWLNRVRVGLVEQGLDWEPSLGRRCLEDDELVAAGMEVDPRGRWRLVKTDAQRQWVCAEGRLRDPCAMHGTTLRACDTEHSALR